MFKYGYELVEYCEKEKKCISTVALEEEAQQGDCTVQDVLDELNKRVDIMNAACIRTLLEPTPSVSGLTGGALLCGADILARSMAATELPVSIFTSLLGAPFLIFLIIRARRQA